MAVLRSFYSDFDYITEPWNEDYEGLLLKVKGEASYKRCRLARKTPKKAGYFTVFWRKDENNRNVPYNATDPGAELVIVVLDGHQGGLFIIPPPVALAKGILADATSRGKMAMRFYPPWCTNLNKTAAATQKWQLQYFVNYEI